MGSAYKIEVGYVNSTANTHGHEMTTIHNTHIAHGYKHAIDAGLHYSLDQGTHARNMAARTQQ